MITLKTLPDATEQEVFDQVVTHLLTQNNKALEEGSDSNCVYRAPKGLKCAAGCLISDEEYDPCIEGESWPPSNYTVTSEHAKFICELQLIHDRKNICDWEYYLRELAIRKGLIFNSPKS